MLVTINVPDDVSPTIIKHYIDELEEKLKQHKAPEQTFSKWKKMVQRIESKSFDLGDYTKTFDQDRQEFRQSFEFKEYQ
jgi:hypothetical protein